jgi:ABC-type Fe3+ transport system permease subunit
MQALLHSLPGYYGTNALILTDGARASGAGRLAHHPAAGDRARGDEHRARRIAEEIGSRGLVMTEVRRLADGLDRAVEAGAFTRDEARALRTELTDLRGRLVGLIPLLWGTLYISLIALLVAVPIGLFAAIYMSEYASKRVRSFAKPLLEVLAGIPTIVYGLLRADHGRPAPARFFAEPLGLGTSGSAVMTAGIVMGIMLIPFVSSLSTTSSTRCRKRCATAPTGSAPPSPRPSAGDPAGRPAGHRRRGPAGRLARHRRDHDRGAGGRGRRHGSASTRSRR